MIMADALRSMDFETGRRELDVIDQEEREAFAKHTEEHEWVIFLSLALLQANRFPQAIL